MNIENTKNNRFLAISEETDGRLRTGSRGETLSIVSDISNDYVRHARGVKRPIYMRIGIVETREVVTPGTARAPQVGDVLKTTAGESVRIICVDRQRKSHSQSDSPIIGLVSADGGGESLFYFDASGRSALGTTSLVLPTMPETREMVTKFWPEEA